MNRNISIMLAAAAVIATPVAAQQAPATDPAFEAKLRTVLSEKPEIVMEAINRFQQRQRDDQLSQQNSRVETLRPALFAEKAIGPVIGNPAGKTTVIELLDYACPFCKRAHVVVDKLAAENKDLRFIILMRPVLGPDSEKMARFALAGDLQGKFQEVHDGLYAKFGDDHQHKVSDETLRDVAQKAGIDYERAKVDMDGEAVTKELARHNQLADQMGVNGTPFFVMKNTIIPGAPRDEQQLLSAINAK